MTTPNAPTREEVEGRLDWCASHAEELRGVTESDTLHDTCGAVLELAGICRALLDENERLRAQLDEEHDTDRTLLHTLITATLCRLPTEIVGERSWDIYLEENRDKWLGDHRAFGGWLSGRITDAINAAREGA